MGDTLSYTFGILNGRYRGTVGDPEAIFYEVLHFRRFGTHSTVISFYTLLILTSRRSTKRLSLHNKSERHFI